MSERSRGWNELLLVVLQLPQAAVRRLSSALTLLVARVVTNDHDPAVPADDAALVADLLDTRLDLHGSPLLLFPVRTASGRGKTDTDSPGESVVTCSGRRSARG
ncbi:hypothetical protein CS0771_06950 [Catellatospora sp. IY07-71]|nr:hypothetical protein CS0771_06950 [Catellatospora sp. IY07-71]